MYQLSIEDQIILNRTDEVIRAAIAGELAIDDPAIEAPESLPVAA